ncbi:MAG: glycerol-3-phosphate dehydrogenase/oxidase [Deltaproteobacteria bacterium]|nr:glycerol-3-phosphate dehydrogenase/oxidase [Deltaproteobacteria bacterium]
MRRDLTRLTETVFDLLIVGGGITGATLAWDASLRGLKVALIDKGDFGCATSAATSKLIHGGLRYLKNGEVFLVRESLRERRIMQTIAGHLVRPIPFMVPTYKKGGNRKWLIKAGMIIYDLLSYDRKRLEDPDQRIPRHYMLSADDVRGLEPGVSPEGLTGAAVYYDCQNDPDRLTLEFILGAQRNGAVIFNYVRATDLICSLGRLESTRLEDLLSGQQIEVKARMVANVAGPWADQIDRLAGAESDSTLKRSQGIHLVTRPLVRKHAVVLQTSAGNHFFIIPYKGVSLIGTTDTEYTGKPDEVSVLDSDVHQFIDEINQAYPGAKLTEADVKYRYIGMRPLIDQETQVYKASRKYEIIDYHRRGIKGYISALGGKYTTSRNLARKLTDRILARLDEPKVACLTDKKLLPGSVSGSFTEYLKGCFERDGDLLPKDVFEHLVWTYGARHEDLLELVRSDSSLAQRLQPQRPEILAQVVMAIESELACTLADILFRRTGLGVLGDPGRATMDMIVDLAARLLGWGSERKARELDTCVKKIAGQAEPAPLG